MINQLLFFVLVLLFPPGAERAVVEMLQSPKVQSYFEGQSKTLIYKDVCNLIDCRRLPNEVNGKPLVVASKEEIFTWGPDVTVIHVDTLYAVDNRIRVEYRLMNSFREQIAAGYFMW